MSMVPIKDLQDAKRLANGTWDGLLPSEKQRALYLLGAMYRYHDDLATYTMFANGRIERLREALKLSLANEPGWRDEAHATLEACPSPSKASEGQT